MTRTQTEKMADAIRRAAEKVGFTDNGSGEREAAAITTVDVAALLKKETYEVEAALTDNGAAIWGCLPMGWNITRRGASGLTVYRPRREATSAS